MGQAAPARRTTTPARARPGARTRPRTVRKPAAHPAAARVRSAVATVPGSLLDRMVRGQGWVLCVGILLAGVVYLNVTVLELNAEITAKSERATVVKRDNSGLRQDLAQLGATETIQRRALKLGMVLPAAAEVRYLRSDPVADARRAARELDTLVAGERDRQRVEIAPVATRAPTATGPG